jgi:agmatine deiminase
MKINATPASLGYRMPAEWQPHRSTWIAWPHNRRDWEGKLSAVHWSFVEMVRHLVPGEHVSIVVQDAALKTRVERMLAYAMVDLAGVDFYEIPTNRSWIRDYGPIFLTAAQDSPVGGSRVVTDWHFNAWARYPNWQKDDAVAATIAAHLNLDCHEPVWPAVEGERRIVLEGGSIEVNGEGLLLTTEECHLDRVQARNPGLGRAELEEVFRAYLGVEKVLWLGKGIQGDDTHGHIDDLARFVGPHTVVTAVEDARGDANYKPLCENLERLQAETDQNGRKLDIVTLPMPHPLCFDGDRLPASYLNFYIGNEVVLVPTFNDPSDRLALGTFSDLFQDREVIGIHAVDLVLGQGTLHCLTQQEPAENETL